MRELTLLEAKKQLANRSISAYDLTKAYLEAVKASDLNAYITITEDKALAMASASDKRIKEGEAGPLEGIPFGIKDLFCTEGVKTTAASRILSNFVPPYESTVSHKLWQAGAVMLGKTNMDEFAMGSTTTNSHYGPTINPCKRKDAPDKKLVAGGSSGGSAAAVAGHIALGALGSDTGGSVRQPASFCGIVGMKPTYGLCSRFRMIAFASSLDQAGVLARTVKDTASILEVIAGYDPRDAQSLKVDIPCYTKHINSDVKGLRVAVFQEFLDGLNTEGQKLLNQGIAWFAENGATIDVVGFPMMPYALPAYYIIAPAEASSNLSRYDGVRYGVREEAETLDEMYALTRQRGFGAEVKQRIFLGTHVLSSGHYDSYYLRAQKVRSLIMRDFNAVFEKYDVILSPTTPNDAFPLDEMPDSPQVIYLNDVYTVTANLGGLPAITVPVQLSERGLPLGLQVIGPQFSEQRLFNVAQFLEEIAEYAFNG